MARVVRNVNYSLNLLNCANSVLGGCDFSRNTPLGNEILSENIWIAAGLIENILPAEQNEVFHKCKPFSGTACELLSRKAIYRLFDQPINRYFRQHLDQQMHR